VEVRGLEPPNPGCQNGDSQPGTPAGENGRYNLIIQIGDIETMKKVSRSDEDLIKKELMVI